MSTNKRNSKTDPQDSHFGPLTELEQTIKSVRIRNAELDTSVIDNCVISEFEPNGGVVVSNRPYRARDFSLVCTSWVLGVASGLLAAWLANSYIAADEGAPPSAGKFEAPRESATPPATEHVVRADEVQKIIHGHGQVDLLDRAANVDLVAKFTLANQNLMGASETYTLGMLVNRRLRPLAASDISFGTFAPRANEASTENSTPTSLGQLRQQHLQSEGLVY